MADITLVDIRTDTRTMSELMAFVYRAIEDIGDDYDIFLDGDTYAIVARPREGIA